MQSKYQNRGDLTSGKDGRVGKRCVHLISQPHQNDN